MTIKEFYKAVGGDYNEVIGRGVKQERIERYLTLFQKEEAVNKLSECVAQKDYEGGFEYSHNLKGLCLNLGLGDLQKASSIICEELRNGTPGEGLEEMLCNVQNAYDKVMDSIEEYLQG